MKAIVMVMLTVGAIASAASFGQKPQNLAQEEAAIRQAFTDRISAQNRDDPAFAGYFAEDADFVNVAGARWRGRGEIAKNLGAFNQANDGSVWTIGIESIRFVRPDVAIVHARWQTPSRRTATGRELGASQGITTQVFVKDDSRWYLSALHNTLIPAPQR